MVTTNLETDLDVANGARGVIVDIILQVREKLASIGYEYHVPGESESGKDEPNRDKVGWTTPNPNTRMRLTKH
jgi:hypothetical protein